MPMSPSVPLILRHDPQRTGASYTFGRWITYLVGSGIALLCKRRLLDATDRLAGENFAPLVHREPFAIDFGVGLGGDFNGLLL